MHRSMAFAKRAFEVPPPSNSFHNVISQLATLMDRYHRFARRREAQQPSGLPNHLREEQIYLPRRIPIGLDGSLSPMPRSTQREIRGSLSLSISPRHGAFPAR
jgi:hypothetical protein